MKKRIPYILLTLLALNAATFIRAAEDPAPSDEQAPVSRTLPFYGKLVEVDTKALTFKVGKREFHLTPETRVTKDGTAATLMDGVVGERVRGAYVKLADGTLRATLVRFGDRPVGSGGSGGSGKKSPSKSAPGESGPE